MTLSTDSAPSGVGRDKGPCGRFGDGCDVVVPILRSGVLAQQFCRYGLRAEVEAVFGRSFYLRSGDLFVCVGEPAIGNGPLTLIADFGGSYPLASLGLCPGQPVCVSDRCIAVGDVVQFTFDRCVPWRQPAWPRARPSCALDDLGNIIAGRVISEAPQEGLGRATRQHESGASETPLARIARPRIARFEAWLFDVLEGRRAPGMASPTPVADLVGLGPGLTPSGDDFLIGALALLDALSERKAHATLACAIAAIPRGMTSALSECLLKTAAAGHLGADLCHAVSAVVSGMPDRAVAAIRRIGHGSGWDMLAGILITLRVVATRDAGTQDRRSKPRRGGVCDQARSTAKRLRSASEQ